MIKIRKSNERGSGNYDWLKTNYSFSFADYYDPDYLGFRSLRVINEDHISPGRGFGTHGHRNMEIITYVLEGILEHKDSLGNGSIIKPNEVQRMSAGKGILHSEFNPSATEKVHLLQIWLVPNLQGIEPSYEQKQFDFHNDGKLILIASENGRENSVTIHQDASLYASRLNLGDRISYSLAPQRHAWIQLARGKVTVNEIFLEAGDGMAISGEEQLNIEAKNAAEFLLFDLN